MRWKVMGADATTGRVMSFTVEAKTMEEAANLATYNGVPGADVTPDGADLRHPIARKPEVPVVEYREPTTPSVAPSLPPPPLWAPPVSEAHAAQRPVYLEGQLTIVEKLVSVVVAVIAFIGIFGGFFGYLSSGKSFATDNAWGVTADRLDSLHHLGVMAVGLMAGMVLALLRIVASLRQRR